MSANVWFEEVNIGLLKELKDTIRIKNANGVLVALDDEALIVRKPEEDFKLEVFPCVSIYNLDNKHDRLRYNPEPIRVGTVGNEAVLEDPAVPFNLTYQIDFWSQYQTDMDSMTKSWLKKHFRQFNLTVIDDGGVERSCNCLVIGGVVKSDLVLKGERLFHSIIKLQIWVELDDETRYNKLIVINPSVDVKET